LLLTHGWPGSTVEFHKVIEPLTDPAAHGGAATDAFHVVCPSLPGFGFSERPSAPGWGVDRIADAWAVLMARLGFDRFAVQGGDWGAGVSTAIGHRHAARVIGVHLNFVLAEMDPVTDDLTEQERTAIEDYAWHQRWGMGYSQLQATRPQTLGYALVDSPAGQCAWILEKFWAWTDCSGDPLSVFSEDELLDNVMMYWLPATGASSGRLYWESFYRPKAEPLSVPVGCTIFPREIRRPSRRWASRLFPDIRWWNEVSRGGHFAAFEQPDIFVDEVRAAFRAIRGIDG
jgi:pimeloyl-ACP methyl ester carboxylesterase